MAEKRRSARTKKKDDPRRKKIRLAIQSVIAVAVIAGIRAGVSFVTRRALDQVMREETGRSLYVPGVSR
jgi:hypothetical protein